MLRSVNPLHIKNVYRMYSHKSIYKDRFTETNQIPPPFPDYSGSDYDYDSDDDTFTFTVKTVMIVSIMSIILKN